MKHLFIFGFALGLPLLIVMSMTTPSRQMSLQWQLAVMNAKAQIPEHHPTVSEFGVLLDSLEKKCSNSREEIFEVCLAGHGFLLERGTLLTLMEFTASVDRAIPQDLAFKMDVKKVVRAMMGIPDPD